MKLSIIIKCLNNAETISMCLDSVLSQSFSEDREILVCDSGSTDSTLSIIKSYQENHPGSICLVTGEDEESTDTTEIEDEVEVFTESHQDDEVCEINGNNVEEDDGDIEIEDVEENEVQAETDEPKSVSLNRSFEKAVHACRGKFVALCNADEYWNDSHKCAKMVSLMEKYPQASMGFHDSYEIDMSRLVSCNQEEKSTLPELIDKELLVKASYLIDSISCCIYRREALEKVSCSFYDEDEPDYLLNVYVMRGAKCVWLPDKCATITAKEKWVKNPSPAIIANRVLEEIKRAKLTSDIQMEGEESGRFIDAVEISLKNYFKRSGINLNQPQHSQSSEFSALVGSLALTRKQLGELTKTVNSIKSQASRNGAVVDKISRFVNKLLRLRPYHAEKVLKGHYSITRYYAFGIRVWKRKKRAVNYNASIGVVNYKYIHILHKTTLTLVATRLIMNNFPKDEHAFVFVSGAPENYSQKLFAKNVFYGNATTMRINPEVTERIIVHGLFSQRLVAFLFLNNHLLSKVYWCIYGGDFYGAPNTERNNYVRANVHAIVTTFDKSAYESRFGEKPTYEMIFTNPLAAYLKEPMQHAVGEPYRVLVNNCADITTLKGLEMLSKFKDDNIEVYTILSYRTVGTVNPISKIVEQGKSIFGDKFKPVYKWMDSSQYANFLADMDIYVSCQNRQQGVGNIAACVRMGKKAFVPCTVSTYSGYREKGIHLFDTTKIEDMSFDEFTTYDENIRRSNIEVMKDRFSPDKQIKLWEKVIYE